MFQGFTDATFEFFMAIRFNNNTDFFHSNHDWYADSVRKPCLALAEALSDTVEEIDPDIERRPNRVLSRINRDLRFSRDKSPYRDYLWLAFRRPDEEKASTNCFYVDISSDGVGWGMGYWRENPEMMRGLRRHIDSDPAELLELLSGLQSYSFSIVARRRMAVPDTVPEPLRDLYRAKGFYFSHDCRDFTLMKTPELADRIRDAFERLAPMYRFLRAVQADGATP